MEAKVQVVDFSTSQSLTVLVYTVPRNCEIGEMPATTSPTLRTARKKIEIITDLRLVGGRQQVQKCLGVRKQQQTNGRPATELLIARWLQDDVLLVARPRFPKLRLAERKVSNDAASLMHQPLTVTKRTKRTNKLPRRASADAPSRKQW